MVTIYRKYTEIGLMNSSSKKLKLRTNKASIDSKTLINHSHINSSNLSESNGEKLAVYLR